MKARVVPFNAIPALKDEEWRDNGRRIWVRNGMAYIPVRDGYRYDTELQDRKPYTGRGYQLIGNIAVIHGAEPTRKEIEEIKKQAGAAGILWICSLNGVERIPKPYCWPVRPATSSQGGGHRILDRSIPGNVFTGKQGGKEKNGPIG